MGKRKRQIVHAEIVTRFAARLRETRLGAGMTQEELGRRAHVTKSYVGRLESGGAAPGIDLVERLATALGATVHDLLPLTASPDTVQVLREQSQKLYEALQQAGDREMFLMLNPLMARLVESPIRRK